MLPLTAAARLRPAAPAGWPNCLAVTPAGDDGGMSAGELVPIEPPAARSQVPDTSGDDELAGRVDELLERSKASATRRAYRSDWRDFVRWCEGSRTRSARRALPASPDTVALYVGDLSRATTERPARSVATIERRLSAIAYFHNGHKVPSPTDDPSVREVMKGIRRELGVAPRQKKGLSTEDLRTVVATLGDKPIEVRDRAILLMGFAGGFRRSELAGLDVEDLEDHPAGLLVRLRSSKTDQERAGRKVEIVYGADEATCPVRAARRWIDLAGSAGPWLRPVDRHGNIADTRLSPKAIGLVVKRYMPGLEKDPRDFAGHSLRRGMATTAARNGAPERTIMRTTGHTHIATVRGYVDDGTLFTDPASGYLGL